MNNIKQLIILTVPHSFCLENNKGSNYECDYRALECANIISKILLNDTREVLIFPANINRVTLDLNRVTSDGFHKLLNDKINSKITEIELNDTVNINNIIYLMDCHSFLGNFFGNASTTNPDVSILMANCIQLNYIQELRDLLGKKDIVTTIHLGSGNSIIEKYFNYDQKNLQSNHIKMIPILIEFNENLTNEKISNIGYCINQWIDIINIYFISIFQKNKAKQAILNSMDGNNNRHKYYKYKVKFINLVNNSYP